MKPYNLLTNTQNIIVTMSRNFYRQSTALNQTCTNIKSNQELDISDLDFNETTCHRTNTTRPFQYHEFILCKSVSQLGKHKISNRMIQLDQNGIYQNKSLAIFHEHIIEKSRRGNDRDVTFNLFSDRVTFSRPTLYEFVTLKDQLAVSSHYSVISLVPMLLEIGRHSRVLECGTGNGSMTLFLSERLGNEGILHTFDIGDHKVTSAKKHFLKWKQSYDLSCDSTHQWPSNVKFGVRNLCEENFSDEFHEFYDSIYLDMANLGTAVTKAYKLLKKNGVLVMNALHLTQALNVLNVIREAELGLEHEIIMEPANRLWEVKKVRQGTERFPDLMNQKRAGQDELSWTCRLEDRFDEKYKRGGMFFNYWSGFLVKFRKVK